MVNEDAVLASAKQDLERQDKDKEDEKKKINFKKIGQNLVTGFVQGAKPQKAPSKNLTEQQQKKFKPTPVYYPKQSQVIKFIAPPQQPTPNIDEYEELKRRINIPKRKEPPTLPPQPNDLIFDRSHMAIKDSDIQFNKDDLNDEDFYGGLDIL